MHLIKADMDWSFLLGRTVETLSISSFVVNLMFDAKVEISIEHEFALDSDRVASSPINRLARAGTLSVLVGQKVVGAATEDEATVALTFSEGIVLRLLTEAGPYECLVIHAADKFFVF